MLGRFGALALSLAAITLPLGSSSDAVGPRAAEIQDQPLVYHLDLDHPGLRQAVGSSADRFPKAKFVRVEVAEVRNQQLIPLEFEVSYQAADGVQERLGSFALYPADNPGKFIVPTKGRLARTGSIVVTMRLLEAAEPGARVEVTIRELAFVEG